MRCSFRSPIVLPEAETTGEADLQPRGVIYKDPVKCFAELMDFISNNGNKHITNSAFCVIYWGILKANLPTPPFGNCTHYEVVLGIRWSYRQNYPAI